MVSESQGCAVASSQILNFASSGDTKPSRSSKQGALVRTMKKRKRSSKLSSQTRNSPHSGLRRRSLRSLFDWPLLQCPLQGLRMDPTITRRRAAIDPCQDLVVGATSLIIVKFRLDFVPELSRKGFHLHAERSNRAVMGL